jgi:hypothetical protein
MPRLKHEGKKPERARKALARRRGKANINGVWRPEMRAFLPLTQASLFNYILRIVLKIWFI